MTTLAERLRDRWSVLDSTANFADLSEHEAMIAIAERDGFSEAVQFIDLLTGGDGEYRYCAIPSERHCPDPVFMALRIAARLSPSPAPQSFEAARHAAFGTANREHDFDGGDCSPEYIFDCGWDAALIAAEALKPSPAAVTRARCIAPSPRSWQCDGEWHRGWDGHDPYCQRCPNWAAPTREKASAVETVERIARALFNDHWWDDSREEEHAPVETVEGAMPEPYKCKHGCERDQLMDQIACLSDAAKEREAIVAWLRGPAFQSRHPEDAAFARHVAAALERGDHLGGDNG